MRTRLLTAFLIVITALSGASINQPSRAQGPQISEADCPEDFPTELEATCGYLSVPERHDGSSNQTIELYFAQIKSASNDPLPYASIYLAGGPGGNGVEWADWYQVLLSQSDLLLLDQRGTGLSNPSLNCPELEGGEADQLEATQACHDRLVGEGIDLAAYNTIENAADVNDLRAALGYEKVIPYGISYGTRVALEMLRSQPDAVYLAVVDAVYPPNILGYEVQGPNTVIQFKVLFDGCAADAACSAAFPDLEKVFYALIETLNANPAEYQITDPTSGETIDRTLDGGTLVDAIFQAMYATEVIPNLPKAIWAVREEDYATYEALIAEGGEGENKQEPEEDISDSEGMNLSVECQEELAFTTMMRVEALLAAAPPEIKAKLISDIQGSIDQCKIWNVPAAPAAFKEPIRSSLPVLILNGEYDPVTPPSSGVLTAATLPNSYNFTFPGVGHGAIDTSECANSIIISFLRDPNTKPDDACIATLPPPAFVTQ